MRVAQSNRQLRSNERIRYIILMIKRAFQARILVAIALVLFVSNFLMFNRPFWAQSSSQETRQPQYAGTWYDANPDKLKSQIRDFFDKAKPLPDKHSCSKLAIETKEFSQPVLAIIAPHAGLFYSGQTSAFAYKCAAKNKVKRVFLLGPSHHVAFKGAVLPASDKFATPLGELAVDTHTVDILKTYPNFAVNARVHQVEHSLELHLPFIKYCFPDAQLIPIVIGQLDEEEDARLIGEILKQFVSVDDLVVVSSDFTHYGPRYGYEPFGPHSADKIAKMDGQAVSKISQIDLDGFISFLKKTDDTICGMYPCQVLMSMLPPKSHGSVIRYATSQDIATDDKENSVSYIALTFSGAHWPKEPGKVLPAKEVVNLSEKERKDLITLAKKTIDSYVKEKKVPSPQDLGITITDSMKPCFGVFVTLTIEPEHRTTNKEHEGLRGCIGSIYPVKPLWQAIQDNAVASCSRDYRFEPVAEDELKNLSVEINVLTPPRRVASYKDIVVGRDGVILSKDKHQAVFLPSVATEWNWTREEMLSHLAQKAGLDKDDWKEGCHFDVFQSEEFR